MLRSHTDLCSALRDFIEKDGARIVPWPKGYIGSMMSDCYEHLMDLRQQNMRLRRALSEKQQRASIPEMTINVKLEPETVAHLLRRQRDAMYGWSPKPEPKEVLTPIPSKYNVILSDNGGVPYIFITGVPLHIVEYSRIYKSSINRSGIEDWFEVSGFLEDSTELRTYRYSFHTEELYLVTKEGEK